MLFKPHIYLFLSSFPLGRILIDLKLIELSLPCHLVTAPPCCLQSRTQSPACISSVLSGPGIPFPSHSAQAKPTSFRFATCPCLQSLAPVPPSSLAPSLFTFSHLASLPHLWESVFRHSLKGIFQDAPQGASPLNSHSILTPRMVPLVALYSNSLSSSLIWALRGQGVCLVQCLLPQHPAQSAKVGAQ